MTRPDPAADLVRNRVHYRGRVQGVGFRATCVQIAADFVVSGWVMNQPDGGVELEAQGAAAEVQRFLDAISREMRGNITRADVSAIARISGETGFQIRF